MQFKLSLDSYLFFWMLIIWNKFRFTCIHESTTSKLNQKSLNVPIKWGWLHECLFVISLCQEIYAQLNLALLNFIALFKHLYFLISI